MKLNRRIVLSTGVALAVAGIVAGGGSFEAVPARAQACDVSYPDFCLPAYPDVDCVNIGYPITVIYDPSIGAFDPHYLDTDYDGVGCELG